MALEKNARLSESKSLESRLGTFNTFNHLQFHGPAPVNDNISSANFGQVVTAAASEIRFRFSDDLGHEHKVEPTEVWLSSRPDLTREPTPVSVSQPRPRRCKLMHRAAGTA